MSWLTLARSDASGGNGRNSVRARGDGSGTTMRFGGVCAEAAPITARAAGGIRVAPRALACIGGKMYPEVRNAATVSAAQRRN